MEVGYGDTKDPSVSQEYYVFLRGVIDALQDLGSGEEARWRKMWERTLHLRELYSLLGFYTTDQAIDTASKVIRSLDYHGASEEDIGRFMAHLQENPDRHKVLTDIAEHPENPEIWERFR